jgi:hypothetical protein
MGSKWRPVVVSRCGEGGVLCGAVGLFGLCLCRLSGFSDRDICGCSVSHLGHIYKYIKQYIYYSTTNNRCVTSNSSQNPNFIRNNDSVYVAVRYPVSVSALLLLYCYKARQSVLWLSTRAYGLPGMFCGRDRDFSLRHSVQTDSSVRPFSHEVG